MRSVLQILLMVSLLGGSAVQALSCTSSVEDIHPCCRALATIKKTTPAHLLKKTSHTSLKGGSCGCAASPAKEHEAPAGSGSVQRNSGASIQAATPTLTTRFPVTFDPPIRLRPANYDSPPPFILHHSLLI